MSSAAQGVSTEQRHSEEIDLLNAAHKDKVEKLQAEIEMLNKGGNSSSSGGAVSTPAAPAAPASGGGGIFSKEGLILACWLIANVASVVLCVGFNKVLYKPP
eukprot:404999_1